MPHEGSDALDAEAKLEPKPSLLVVDSLQHVHGAGAPAENNAQAVLALKEIAMRNHVAVLVTAHLPELPPNRENLRPQLHDFGAMGAIKQLADVVLGLFREEIYHPVPGSEGAAELAILKNGTARRRTSISISTSSGSDSRTWSIPTGSAAAAAHRSRRRRIFH